MSSNADSARPRRSRTAGSSSSSNSADKKSNADKVDQSRVFQSSFGKKWHRVYEGEVHSPLINRESQKDNFTIAFDFTDRQDIDFYNSGKKIKEQLSASDLIQDYQIPAITHSTGDDLTEKLILSVFDGKMTPAKGANIDHIQPLMPGKKNESLYNKDSIVARIQEFQNDLNEALINGDAQQKKEAAEFVRKLEDMHYIIKKPRGNPVYQVTVFMAKEYANDLGNLLWMSPQGNSSKSNKAIINEIIKNRLFGSDFLTKYNVTHDGGILYKGRPPGSAKEVAVGLSVLLQDYIRNHHPAYLDTTHGSTALHQEIAADSKRALESTTSEREQMPVLAAAVSITQGAYEGGKRAMQDALSNSSSSSSSQVNKPQFPPNPSFTATGGGTARSSQLSDDAMQMLGIDSPPSPTSKERFQESLSRLSAEVIRNHLPAIVNQAAADTIAQRKSVTAPNAQNPPTLSLSNSSSQSKPMDTSGDPNSSSAASQTSGSSEASRKRKDPPSQVSASPSPSSTPVQSGSNPTAFFSNTGQKVAQGQLAVEPQSKKSKPSTTTPSAQKPPTVPSLSNSSSQSKPMDTSGDPNSSSAASPKSGPSPGKLKGGV